MAMPQFTRTLHFRISTLFLLLLAVVGGGFWLWLNATIFTADIGAEEQNWYDNLAEGELDSLAGELGGQLASGEPLADLLIEYGQAIDRFDAEIILFDTQGANLHSSNPDSLGFTVTTVDATLLESMAQDDWDYDSYPNPDDIQAYENRIFEVDRIFRSGDSDSTTTGYLVASFRPLVIGIEELEGEERKIGYQAILMILVAAALSGLVIMGWLSRRIGNLSDGVQKFASGNLAQRVPSGRGDEIATLGGHFNTMASHIEEMVEKLQQKELFQRQLIANISHDLRTPLASMQGYAETLSMSGTKLSQEDRDRYLAIITANLKHLDDLIDHMLTLSRFESGQAVSQVEEFPLAELVDSVIMRCEPLAAELGLTLELDCDEPCEANVSADPMQIAQVLQNLIENGIKFNRRGGRVTVRLEPEPDRHAVVKVIDTGMGIAPEDLPHIFERFYTADKSRSRTSNLGPASLERHLGQSSGLGLAIAAKIVAAHGSELQVESQLDAGSTFLFSLPMAQAGKALEAEGS